MNKPLRDIIVALTKILEAIKSGSGTNQGNSNGNITKTIRKPIAYYSVMTQRVVTELSNAYDDWVDTWHALYEEQFTSNDENVSYLLGFNSEGHTGKLYNFTYGTNVRTNASHEVTVYGETRTLWQLYSSDSTVPSDSTEVH